MDRRRIENPARGEGGQTRGPGQAPCPGKKWHASSPRGTPWQQTARLLYALQNRKGTNRFVSTSPDEPVAGASRPAVEHVQGIVERVTYHADDSGYTVARLKAPGSRDLITFTGRFPDIHAGQT